MRQRIGRIAELINVKSAWNFAGQPRRHILIIFRMPSRHIGARQPDLGAKGADVRDFFLRHLVRYNENYAVAFRRRDQSESQSGVARGRFNDRAARPELAIPFRRLHHHQRDAIFDRASWILIFQLQKKVTWPGVDPSYFDERGVADEGENRGRMFSRFLGRDQSCDHPLLQTKFLGRVINHDPEVSKKIVADNAIEPGTKGLTEHGEEIGYDHDDIVDSRTTHLERF